MQPTNNPNIYKYDPRSNYSSGGGGGKKVLLIVVGLVVVVGVIFSGVKFGPDVASRISNGNLWGEKSDEVVATVNEQSIARPASDLGRAPANQPTPTPAAPTVAPVAASAPATKPAAKPTAKQAAPAKTPVAPAAPTNPTNPYSVDKAAVENIAEVFNKMTKDIADLSYGQNAFKIADALPIVIAAKTKMESIAVSTTEGTAIKSSYTGHIDVLKTILDSQAKKGTYFDSSDTAYIGLRDNYELSRTQLLSNYEIIKTKAK